jgi:peptide/nickel transport system permease protein
LAAEHFICRARKRQSRRLAQLAVQSVTTQDLPVIIGTVVLASACIVGANIAADIAYALLASRVRVN